MKRAATILLETLGALFVVAFFACFGDTGTFSGAWHQLTTLAIETVHGRNLDANYWTITGPQAWYSLRLVLVAVILSLIIGLTLTILRLQLRNRYLKLLLDSFLALTESIPESMYVVIAAVSVLLLLSVGIVLPIFPALDPKWNDTWVPALALAAPGSLYLQRILTLRLRDELSAQYITTARAKGNSSRRIFFRHMLPNLIPTFVAQIPVVVALVVSSALFAEFFLEYTGALFIFTNFATGWNFMTGIPLTGPKVDWLPLYQPGLVFLIGAIMVAPVALVRLGILLYRKSVDNRDHGTVSGSYARHSVRKIPLFIGSGMLILILFFGLFPKLLSPYNPYHTNQSIILLGISLAAPPTHAHPLGTDDFGRDLLAATLNGTFYTLGPALAVTAITVIGSLIIASFLFANPKGWLQTPIRFVSQAISLVPSLFILFLALYLTMGTKHQALNYMMWIAVIEMGRGSYAFAQTMKEWRGFVFIEGATSIGRSNLGLLVSHLRSWLGYFSLEFTFSEFARVLSLMTQLAAFHIFFQSHVDYLPFYAPVSGVVANHFSWVSMIGDAAASMLYVIHPYILYGPVLALMMTMIGANLIARGLRG